jgi:hypothetical protein
MKSYNFLLVLFISITIIYLVLCQTGIQYQYNLDNLEHFDSKISPQNSIAFKLGISENRIRNYKEKGNADDTNNFKVEFEIHPRTIFDKKSEPYIDDIELKLNDMIDNKDIIKLQSTSGQNIYMGKIKVNTILKSNYKEEKEKEKEMTKSKFVDPSLKFEINYLKSLERGIPEEPSIEPRYKFNNVGKLKLETIPTPTQAVKSS